MCIRDRCVSFYPASLPLREVLLRGSVFYFVLQAFWSATTGVFSSRRPGRAVDCNHGDTHIGACALPLKPESQNRLRGTSVAGIQGIPLACILEKTLFVCFGPPLLVALSMANHRSARSTLVKSETRVHAYQRLSLIHISEPTRPY